MRFHFGVSFRFKYLKKFLFPILIGFLTYLFSSYINLGVVHAMTNLDSKYDITLQELDLSKNVYSDKTAQELLDEIVSKFSLSDYDLYIYIYYNGNYTLYINIINSSPSIPITISGYESRLYVRSNLSGNSTFCHYYSLPFGQTMSSSNSLIYNNLMSTLNDISSYRPLTEGSASSGTNNQLLNGFIIRNNSNFNNTDSYTFDLSDYGYIYYSSKSLVYTLSIDESSISRFQKQLIINGKTYENQDDLPSYYDLYIKQPEPEPEPEPNPDDTDKTMYFSKYVYWFGEHDSTDEILENIYVLLFLSFSGIFFLKCVSIIKNTRW